GTFDVTVLRKQADGIEILGTPEGIERLGGIDFDEAVLSHINFASDGALAELDVRDPAIAVALARLRQDCVLAKESLSVDTETLIPVFLPGRNFDVRITREDFEKLVRAQVESTIGALSRTLRSARLEPDELSAVLLVGGSSRIPLVAEMVSAEIGRPIVVDTHPKYAVALGAATLAATAPGDSGPRASATPPPPPKPPAEPEQPTRALQQLLPPVPVAPVPTPGAQSVSAPSVSAQSVSAQSSAPSGPPPTAPATAPPTPLPARNTPSPSYQPPGDPSGYQPPGDPSGYQPPGDPSGYQPPGDPSGYQPPGGGHYQPPGGGTSGYQPPGGGTGYPSADPHAPEQPVWGHPQHPGGAPEQNPYPGQYPEQNPYQGQPQEYGQYPGYGSPTGPGQYPYQGQPQQWHQGPPQATASGNGTGQSVGRAIAYGLALVVLAVVVAYLAFTVVSKLRGLG
ncbi:MAG: Hsp70 family protein, partial [Pseudonocardia sp.]